MMTRFHFRVKFSGVLNRKLESMFQMAVLAFAVLISPLGCSSRSQDDSNTVSNESTLNALPVYDVTQFGAVGDGEFLNSRAIQSAIDMAAEAGGGQVYIPAGTFRCGTIQLKSNVSLYLEQGCTLSGSERLADYDSDHQHLIYAEDAKNVVLRGAGEINGNGPTFWDEGRLQKWIDGKIDLPRPKDMIRFDRCQNIKLENIQVKDGAFWNIGLGHCSEISIHGIRIRTGVYEDDGPNTDGINLWHCQRVTISDCDIVTGDDCIVVLGESRDVAIDNCLLQTSETALMISGVRNLSFANSTIHDSGCGIGFRVWNEIVVDGVVINNITMDVSPRFEGGGTAIYIWSFPIYTEESVPADSVLPAPGVLRNVTLSNIIASSNGLVCVNGAKDGYVQNLTLENIQFTMYGGKVSEYNENPPYPYPIYGFHHGSPYGMFFRYVDGLKLRDVQVRWQQPEKAEWGSALRCWHVKDVEIEGFDGRQSLSSQAPSISLKNVDGAFVHGCRAPEGTTTFLELQGKTRSVAMFGNDLQRAQKALDNHTPNEVKVSGTF